MNDFAGLGICFRGDAIGFATGDITLSLEPIEANFIPRNVFLKFLREHGEVAVRAAEMLSDIYHATYREVRYLGLSGSAGEKLARFILDLAAESSKTAEGGHADRIALTLTHDEIAQMLGSFRETVADFRRKRLIEVHGSTLVITNEAGLEKTFEP